MTSIKRDQYEIIIPKRLNFLYNHINSTFYDYFEYFESENNILDFSERKKHTIKKTGEKFWFSNLPSFYEKAEFYAKNLHNKSGDIIIYAGAYCGICPIFLSKLVGENGRIFAFEPDSENFECLKLNLLEHNINNVIPLNIALTESTTDLFNGFLEFRMDNSITSVSINNGIFKVDCKSINWLIKEYNLEKIDSIIIDVGGYEYNILATNLKFMNNAEWFPSSLFSFKPKILIETHQLHGTYPFPQLQEFFERQGYSCRELERFLTVFPTFICKPNANNEGPDLRVKSHKDFLVEFPEFKNPFTILALAGSWNNITRSYDIYACNKDDAYWQTHIDRFFRCFELFLEPLLKNIFNENEPQCKKFTFLLSDGNQYAPYSKCYIVDGKHINYPCFAWAFEDNIYTKDLDNIILIPDYYLTGDTLPHRHIDSGIKLSEYWKYEDKYKWGEKQLKFFWRGSIQCLSSPFSEKEYKNNSYLNQRLKFLLKCRNSKFREYFDCYYSSGSVTQLKSPENLIPELTNYSLFSSFTSRDDFWRSKFIFVVEGYSYSSPATYQTLSSQSCPIFIDSEDAWWYKHNFIPGVHYILIKRDLSDFEQQIQWCINNLDKCEKIAENSRQMISRINPDSAIKLTKQVFEQVLIHGNLDYKKIYDFTDRKYLLEAKLKKDETNVILDDKKIIPISLGGWCGIADIIREILKLNPIAYPFDYIRTTFEGIIHFIKTDFENFFDITREPIPIPGNSDLILYPGKFNAFYSHDPKNIETQESFKRRFNKFNNLLNSGNEVLFFRAMTHLYNHGETDKLETFTQTLKDKYPSLKWKLILISHRATDDNVNSIRLVRKMENIYIWTVAIKFPVEQNYCNQYKRIIEYTVDENNIKEEGIEINQINKDIKKHEQKTLELYNHWNKDDWLGELGLK